MRIKSVPMRLKNLFSWALLFAIFPLLSLPGCKEKAPEELPNILWLTSEDNSPLLGCYGDSFATTPNLDRMAGEGFLYIHAYANAPQCAPARNTIITGVYANSNGNQHMRSYYPISETIKTYPEFLRAKGYYCTNNSKTDYNTDGIDPKKIWDECSNKAHYRNRKPGQPFFAVFNATVSHESQLFDSIPDELLRHKPDEVTIPPYHPATPTIKHDWAQYYDKIEDMDTQIGKWLQELEDEGLAENTIVFYYSDHGGVLLRSKRYLYETGTRVAFIVRIPKKFKHLYPEKNPGSKVDRLISFVDLAPTLLSLTGIEIPEYFQGNAFLGDQVTEEPEYVYIFRDRAGVRYDQFRALRSKKFRYIINYLPHRSYGHHSEYVMQAPSALSWEQAWRNGQCNELQSRFWLPKPVEELYNTENDPWEIINLAEDPAYKEVLEKMRAANREWLIRIYDTGFIPEADLVDRLGNMPAYDYMRSDKVDIDEILEAAETAACGESRNLEKLQTYLKSDESAVRYWGATGLLILGEKAAEATGDLTAALNDESESVVIVAAEALYNLGKKQEAINAFVNVFRNSNKYACLHALNAIDCIEMGKSDELVKSIVEMLKNTQITARDRWDLVSAVNWQFEKWNIDPAGHDL